LEVTPLRQLSHYITTPSRNQMVHVNLKMQNLVAINLMVFLTVLPPRPKFT